MVLHSCRMHSRAAVSPQKLPVWGKSYLRLLAQHRPKRLALGSQSWRQGLPGCRQGQWKICRAESITTESEPTIPEPSEAADAPEGADAPGAVGDSPPPGRPISEAVVGETYEGTVVGLPKFGAFVNIGFEKDALIHISQLSDTYISDPHEVLKRGEVVTCILTDVDIEQNTLRATIKSDDRENVPVDDGPQNTRKKGPGQPSNKPPFQVGDEVTATIFKVHTWGAFAVLPDGFSGLLHVSEFTAVRDLDSTAESPNAANYVQEGDDITVNVLSIKDGKISLTQRTNEEVKEANELKKSGLIAGMEEDLPCLFDLLFSHIDVSRDKFSSLPEGASLSYDEDDEIDSSVTTPLEEASTSEPGVPESSVSKEVEVTQEPSPLIQGSVVSEDKAQTTEAPVAAISATMVKQLRDISGAGMMDCKKALTEANGDMAEAEAILKKKGIASAAKKAGRIAAEGAIGAYIHTGSRLGVLVEVNCETDFVARNPIFKELVEDIAMQVAASTEAICVSVDDFPQDVLEKEKQIELAKEDLQSKPEAIREKIVTGRLDKLKKTAALLEQPYIKDTNKTVSQLVTDVTATLGEKISVRRFEKFMLGEGLEKRSTDFASEVAEQTQKKEATEEKEEPAEKPQEAREEPDVSNVVVSAKDVKELRVKSGAGMMDCKKALQQCNGNMEEAEVYLKVKGMAVADKKAGRIASEGRIGSYIHTGARLGVLAEINCETDFVSRGDIFKELVENMCMQIAASPEVQYVRQEDIPKAIIEKERAIEMSKEDLQNKPEQVREKMVEGRLQKYAKLLSLMDQPYIKDNNKTVEEAVKEAVGTIGENIQVRRFTRFNLGEGLEKRSDDFAAEVAAQTQGK